MNKRWNVTEMERPMLCPFLLNYELKYGEDDRGKKWKCKIENTFFDDGVVKESCTNGYRECEMFSLGIHYRDIPKRCPCASSVKEYGCELATGTGRGCGHREQYEYLECERFSKWFYEHRKEVVQ